MKSAKPGKQRKRAFSAPLHMKQKFIAARLSKDLRKQIKKRSLSVRTGDEVKVVRGKHKGTTGKVGRVDLKFSRVYLENLKRRKVSGEEAAIPVHASNLILMKADLSDDRRLKSAKKEKKVKSSA